MTHHRSALYYFLWGAKHMELQGGRSRLCSGWLSHLPVRVVEQGLDSVGHTRMGIVITPIASVKGHFILVVVWRFRKTAWYCCAMMVVFGPAGLDYIPAMSLLSVRWHPNMQKCPFFCAACSRIHSQVIACDHWHMPAQTQFHSHYPHKLSGIYIPNHYVDFTTVSLEQMTQCWIITQW
jgi:hypothetical protein